MSRLLLRILLVPGLALLAITAWTALHPDPPTPDPGLLAVPPQRHPEQPSAAVPSSAPTAAAPDPDRLHRLLGGLMNDLNANVSNTAAGQRGLLRELGEELRRRLEAAIRHLEPADRTGSPAGLSRPGR